jgi:excinuclease ABC subunit A
MNVIQELVDKGNTVIIIEHNLDVVKCADHIIDIGPEGGDKGGKIVAAGTPEEIVNNKLSATGEYLKAYINQEVSVPIK